MFFAWVFGQAAGHTIFLFLVAALIALLLDPIVLDARGGQDPPRHLGRVRVPDVRGGDRLDPRSRSGPSSSPRRRRPPTRFNDYFTVTNGQISRSRPIATSTGCSTGSTHHHLQSIKIEKSGHRLVKRIRKRDVGRYTHRIVNFVEGAAISIGKALFDCVLILVVSIYMLLDMQRLARAVDRRFPPHDGQAADLADGARARLVRPRARSRSA